MRSITPAMNVPWPAAGSSQLSALPSGVSRSLPVNGVTAAVLSIGGIKRVAARPVSSTTTCGEGGCAAAPDFFPFGGVGGAVYVYHEGGSAGRAVLRVGPV